MEPDELAFSLTPFFIILAIGAAIGVAVYLVRNVRRGEGFQLPLRGLFHVYLYLVCVVTLLVMVSGLAHLVRAGLGAAFGKEFSYYPQYVDYPKPMAPPREPMPVGDSSQLKEEQIKEQERIQEEQRLKGLERALKEGLLKGTTFAIIGGILWGVHVWGRRRLESREEREQGVLNRIYLVLLLVVFSVITIVSLPSAAYETLRYALLDRIREGYYSPPGGKLATAITTLPFWLMYLAGTVRLLRR